MAEETGRDENGMNQAGSSGGRKPVQKKEAVDPYAHLRPSPQARLIAWIVVLVAAVVLLVTTIIFLRPAESPRESAACPTDAKVCPDGIAVGRTGPNCEFAACPSGTSCEGGECPTLPRSGGVHEQNSVSVSPASDVSGIADWGLYDDEHISFSYPAGWSVSRTAGSILVASESGESGLQITTVPSTGNFGVWVEENTSSGFAIVTECEALFPDGVCNVVNATDVKHFLPTDEAYMLISYIDDDPEKATIEKIIKTVEFR